MTPSIQEAVLPLFNAAEIPPTLQPAWQSYVDLLVASPKKSVLYYWAEENGAIPWWTLLRSLLPTRFYHTPLWDTVWQRIDTQLDRRRPVCIVVDDYVSRRYGKKAYLANWFYSNVHGGVVWGNQLVDTVIRNGALSCPVTFEFHRRNGPKKVWERGLTQVRRVHARLRAAGVRTERLWTLGDCTYGNAAMARALRRMDGFYLLGIPKSRTVELFGRSCQIEQYFASLPEYQLTVANKLYRYKISTANLKDWGCHRLLAVWDPRGRWRYFASNKRKTTAKTLLQRMRARWTVEDTHRTLKQHHGAEHFHIWSPGAVKGHFELVYLSGAVAGLERAARQRRGERCTWERLHREAIRWSRLQN
jgi:hypothetical protein